uniref:centrosomal protein of 152 kDa-like n=1 Tax=Styela clava TaxID=7725 RepID=UPI001939322A|nr:centrosomal protein of 152 kDa-like [Styela clava]XP_039265982.1 centrosomal protein of 152 kDa-like [Styela clava]
MSVIHPGSSINFDAENLQQNDDEDEMLQEELRQQKELRELLSAELSDDLLDDDHSSVNDSHRSLPQDVSNEQHESVESPVITSTGWMQNGGNYNVTQPITTSTSEPYYGRNGYDVNIRNPYNYQNGQQQYYDPSYDIVTSQSQPQWHQQQQGYGNNMMFQQSRDNGVGQYIPYQNEVPSHQNGEYPFAERGEVEGMEDYGEVLDGNHIQQQQFIQYNPQRNAHPSTTDSLTPSPGSKLSYRQSYPPNTSKYGRPKHDDYNRYGHNSPHDISVESSPADPGSRERDKLQQQFTSVANDVRGDNGQQMAQLQILYKARGKKIDEISRELEDLKNESAREKRILNHQLAMAKDQKDGMGTSLEESQRLTQSKDRDIEDLRSRLDSQHSEIEALKSNKNELLTKIQVSERTIESLHEQLTQMSHSEAIERARDQHDAVLNAQTQRHEMQVLELTTQLDECRQEMNEKTEEVDKLRFHLNKISRESEQTLLDKTETINRLTKSLEDAQNQCQGLLAGSSENAFARHQVGDLLEERKKNEEEIACLKMQARDAEEHLKLYENALQLGASNTGGPRNIHTRGGSLSDSLSELMNNDVARKLDWKTPKINKSQSEETISGSQEELIDGLRRELQRALNCNKAKRDEVTKLKQQCSELVDESSHWRTRADEAKSQLKLTTSTSAERADIENNQILIQEFEEKLKEAQDEVERLEQTNREVKQRMVEMIQEHDQDKQDAVERCERALMQLHEDAKQTLRDELMAEHEQKLYEISVENDARIRELSTELAELQHELHDVKQSYVHVCAEKDNIQSNVQQELTEQYEKEKEEFATDHENAIKKLEKMLSDLEIEMNVKIKEEKENCEGEWEKEREKIIGELRDEWEKEKEGEFTQRIETQIALAKVNWFEEFSNSKQKAIHTAVKAEEEKWNKRIEELRQDWEEKKNHELERKMNEEQEKWNLLKEEEIQKLQNEFQSEKESAVKMATCMAELNKTLHKENIEEESRMNFEKQLKEVEESWMKEKDELMKEARKSWEQEKEKLIQDVVEETRKKMEDDAENERKTQKSVMEKAIFEVKKICNEEKQNSLKQKNIEMEREIKILQEQHKTDYEMFVDEHKKTLASFLQQEKSKSITTSTVTKDSSTQAEMEVSHQTNNYETKEKTWKSEREEIINKNKNELDEMQRKFEAKFEELRNEIEQLMKERNELSEELKRNESRKHIEDKKASLTNQLELSHLQLENERLRAEMKASESKVEKLSEKNTNDINRLKERMRDEYRRWKKERSSLVSKLKESSSSPQVNASPVPNMQDTPCKFCQSSQENKEEILKHKDEATRKAISELTEIYAGTLKMIKDEMMTYIGESRCRTKETISRERNHTASKLKTHYNKVLNRVKPEKDIHAQLIQRLKLLESDTDSRPETPQTSTSRRNSSSVPQSSNSYNPSIASTSGISRSDLVSTTNKPTLSQINHFSNQYDDVNHLPTKLTPELHRNQQQSAFKPPILSTRQQSVNNPVLYGFERQKSTEFQPQNVSNLPIRQKLTKENSSDRPTSQNFHSYVSERDSRSQSSCQSQQFSSKYPPVLANIDFSPRRTRSDNFNYSQYRDLRTPGSASMGGTYKPTRP